MESLPSQIAAPPSARPARRRAAWGDRGVVTASRPRASLYLRVFLVNAALLVIAAIVLAATPATVSFPVRPDQVLMLAVGLAVLLAANALLLRVSLGPLRDLTQLMRRIDLLVPGERLHEDGPGELRDVIASFNEMLDRLELERRTSSTRTLEDQEDERHRISRELHDEVGQGLTAVLLQLKGLAGDVPAELEPRLAAAQEVVRSNLEEVRRIARQLRPTVLDDLGLAYAVHALLDVFEETARFAVDRRVELDLPALPAAAELALFRIAQESLTNVARHASASRVELTLAAARRHVEMTIHDDGVGLSLRAGREGGGIRGMRERALAVGASLRASAPPSGGTIISVRVPVIR